MSKKLRFVDAKLFVKSLGLTLSAHQGEFIVSIPRLTTSPTSLRMPSQLL
jgi:hypothetical protein